MTRTLAPGRRAVTLAAVVALVAAMSATAAAPRTAPVATSAASAAGWVDAGLEAALADGPASAIVQVSSIARAPAKAAIVASGGELGFDLPIVDGFTATLTAAALDALRAVPGIWSISLDGPVRVSHSPAPGDEVGDHVYDQAVGATRLHEDGITGAGVGIAVIDTGVTPGDDLAGRVVGGIDLTGNDSTLDEYGHGTFVAGVAAGSGSASAGEYAGVAPGAHIVPIKLAGADGTADLSVVLAGIQWAVSYQDAHDIGVLNLSLGSEVRQPRMRNPLNYAVERAWDSGLVVVASAGNYGEDRAASMPTPANDPLVITVGATDFEGTAETDDDTVAAYSTHGPTRPERLAKPDLVAPGSHIVSLRAQGSTIDAEHPETAVGDTYLRGSGTSFSAAVTSGAVALLLQAHSDWTPDEIKGALTATARPLPSADARAMGAGALDVAAASTLVDPPAANQGVTRVTVPESEERDERGRDDRARDDDRRRDDGRGDDRDGPDEDPLVGDWTPETWQRHTWYGHTWYGHTWYGHTWYGHTWYGHTWYGHTWYVADWS